MPDVNNHALSWGQYAKAATRKSNGITSAVYIMYSNKKNDIQNKTRIKE